MKNIQNLTIDINKKPFQSLTANVGEVASRFIKITILENNIPADLTGVTAYLYAKKADGTKVFNSVTVEDAKKGIVLAELTSQVLAIPGLVKLNLLLTKNGAKLASKQIIVTVDESAIDEEAIQSTNEFNALTDALKKVNNIDNKMDKGEKIQVSQIDKNSGKIDQTFLSEELLQQMAGNTPINAIPADNSITTNKLADNSITTNKLDKKISNLIQHGMYQVYGKFETFKVNSDMSVTVTWTRLYLRKSSEDIGQYKDYYITPNTDGLTIKSGEYLYIDLEGYTTGDVELIVGTPPTTDFVGGEKYIVFSNLSGRYAGDLAGSLRIPNQYITNDFMALNSIRYAKTEAKIQNMLDRGTWEILASPIYNWTYSNGDLTISDLGRCYVYNGATGTVRSIESTTSLSILANQIAYIDLEDTELLNDNSLPIRIGDNPFSGVIHGDGAFAWDRKIPLVVNVNGRISGALVDKLNHKQATVEDPMRQTGVWFKMDQKPIYYDPSTRTLTWEGTLLYLDRNMPPNAANNRVKLKPGSYTFTDHNYSICYLDLNEVTTFEENDPTICVKGGVYYLGGYEAKRGQIPIAKFDAYDKGFEVINFPSVSIKGELVDAEVNTVNDDLIYVNVTANKQAVIIRQCGHESGKYYIGIRFVHSVSPSINADIWRLAEASIYTKNDDGTFSMYGPGSIVNDGEWECALKEQGASDFMGGMAHGDEMMKDITFLIDGLPVDLTITNSYVGKRIVILESSELNRCDTPSEILADHVRHYEFTKDDLIVTQKVVWKESITMGKSYLTMFPIKRTMNNDETSDYITNKGFKNVYFKPLDLSWNHPNRAYEHGGITEATIWNDGPGYKVFGRVEVLESNKLPNENMAFSASNAYNKFYFDYCGDNYITKVGEVWNNKARYILDFKGYEANK